MYMGQLESSPRTIVKGAIVIRSLHSLSTSVFLVLSWQAKEILLAPQTLYAYALTWRRIDFTEAYLLSEKYFHCAPFYLHLIIPAWKAPHGGKIETLKRSHWRIATLVNLYENQIQRRNFTGPTELCCLTGHLIHKYHKKAGVDTH